MEQLGSVSPACVVWPHVAFLCLSPATSGCAQHCTAGGDDWLTHCYQLTPRVQRLSATAVTLDLGRCTDAEAQRALCGLMRRLDVLGASTRVGIAPTPALAQLSVLAAPPRQRIVCVSPSGAAARMRQMPVILLAQLLPRGAIPPETVERLRHYGLHTLGHIATFSEAALRQQFGSVGATLAALAHGRDPHPFCPTPPPPRLRFSMRFPTPAPASRILAALPAWTEQIGRTLTTKQIAVRELRLDIGWERGACAEVRTVLRQRTHEATTLLEAVRKLLLPLLLHENGILDQSLDGQSHAGGAHLDLLRLTVLDVAPDVAQQGVFWRARAQRQAALVPIADALARRHGRPLVLRADRVAAEAVFPEERYHLRTFADLSYATAPARSQVSVSPSPGPARSPGWEHVPHRLHWW